jgi:4-hydroxy-4-methyl-2-oxoglutarate aldolase
MTDRILDEFSVLPTTCVSDALSGRTTMDFSIKPVAGLAVVGRAFTVKLTKGQNKEFLRALKLASNQDVIVVNAEGDTSRAIAGDFVLGMAKTLGIRGVVVDGVIRDLTETRKLNFPVFAKGTSPNAGLKSEDGMLTIPISCGGVVVNHGDIIIGDADGVVVVPKEIEQEVLVRAQEKLKKDAARERQISNHIDEIHQYIDAMTK